MTNDPTDNPVPLNSMTSRTLSIGEPMVPVPTPGDTLDVKGMMPITDPPCGDRPPLADRPTRADAVAAPPIVGPISNSALSRYRILRPHAKGGLGEVFVAVDQELHREVALKEIQHYYAHDPDSRARFLLEAEVTGRLEHPSIVPVYGLGSYSDGRPYYAMRFIQGESFKDAINRYHQADRGDRDPGQRALELRQLLRRFLDVCNAIAYAHSRGVLHRDLKPANVMLGQFGESLVVDWGLAKAMAAAGAAEPSSLPGTAPISPSADSTCTMTGAVLGTPAYMSPEQAIGALDRLTPASDIFSLGAILATVLTGKPPYQGSNVLEKAQGGDWLAPRQINPRVPAALDAVSRKAMAFDPNERYRTALDLAAEVEHWLADEPVRAYPEPWLTRAGRCMRRHRTLVTSGTAALVMAALGLWLLWAMRAAADRREAESRGREAEARTAEAESYERQGIIDSERGRKADALKSFETAQAKLHGLELTGRLHRQRLARIAYNVATASRDLGRLDRAAAAYQETINAYEALVMEDPSVPEMVSDLADAYTGRAGVLLMGGHFIQALGDFEGGFEYQHKAVALAPDNMGLRLRLSALHNGRALVYERLGKFDTMQADLEACLKILEEARERIAAAHDSGLDQSRRHHLALARQNMGNVYTAQARFDNALAEYAVAEKVAEGLCADDPGRPDYEEIVAKCDVNAGYIQLQKGNLNGAVATLKKAQLRLVNLTRRFPWNDDIAFRLATCLSNLASASFLAMQHIPLSEVPKALKVCEGYLQEAGQLLDKIKDNRKDADQIAILQGANFLGRAMVSSKKQEWAEALSWVNRGIDHLKASIKTGDANPTLASRANLFLGMRAQTFYELRKFPEALKDVDQVLANNGDRMSFGLLRCGILARSGAHGDGVASLERILAGVKEQPPELLMDAASVYSVALDGLAKDEGLSAKQKEDQARVYAARSVELLRQAVKAGYKNLDKLRDAGPAGDRDLVPLRSRAEFKQFLRELPAAKPAR
jgi:tetratricopeptide (TPR) repeat protein